MVLVHLHLLLGCRPKEVFHVFGLLHENKLITSFRGT